MRLGDSERIDLGEKIRAARKQAKITQKELADACFTAQSNISSYENGKIIFASPDLLNMISNVLGIRLLPEPPLQKFLRLLDERCESLYQDRGFKECYDIAVTTAKETFYEGVIKR